MSELTSLMEMESMLDSVEKPSEIFGELVFNEEAQRQYLPDAVFEKLQEAIRGQRPITEDIADAVAAGMKAWAIDMGATHYTHWFQPLAGTIAQKHDSFLALNKEGKPIEKFSGKALVQQEPDASSFPSGGIRSTFEARGYTAWDPSSPAFIMETGGTRTLCIPAIFVSYTGEALDYKTPLIRSIHALNKYGLPVVKLFFPEATRIFSTMGWEQEYFLIDEQWYEARPDLILTGRTLVGALPPKNQQLEDHYFASIPDRVLAFMADLEYAAYRLGIPLHTRHNEVAPSQYECAPWFEEANISNDHNQLLMDLMDRVARRHGLRVLLHEKPFAGINGSGKHMNWSIGTDSGRNLLAPGKTPETKLAFLTFFVNVIKAINDWNDLVRASIASDSNDLRLGGHEAPPAIISVYIGDHLQKVIDRLEQSVPDERFLTEEEEAELKMFIHETIPTIFLDNTDRNRTSPFAFTGNKFELRAVGASMNCAQPATVLNTIMAYQLKQFYEDYQALVDKGAKKELAILEILHKYVKESKRVIFNGDNYSEDWVREAERRGLNNIPDTPTAIKAYVTDEAIKLFEETGVSSRREVEARYNVRLEKYAQRIHIEAMTLIEMANQQILPPAIQSLSELAATLNSLPTENAAVRKRYEKLSELVERLNSALEQLQEKVEKAEQEGDLPKQAELYAKEVRPAMEEVRKYADELERIMDDRLWQLPHYREILFIK